MNRRIASRVITARRMVNTKSHNRSTLTAEESKALPTRQPNAEESKILGHLKELYSSSAPPLSEATYEMFAEDAVFHDPVGFARGIKQIREQFNGLAKIFDKSDVLKMNLLENPPKIASTTLLVDQDVAYYTNANKSPVKTVNSLVTLERDANGKIKHFQEEWDHKGEPDSSDGFFGMISEARKKLTANITGAFVDPKVSENK